MFEKKKKILKADELRQRANTLAKKQEKLLDEWIRENEGKSAKEQKLIDRKYLKLLDEAEIQADNAYKSYHDFVHKNFSKSKIEKGVQETKNFMSKAFIKKLENK